MARVVNKLKNIEQGEVLLVNKYTGDVFQSDKRMDKDGNVEISLLDSNGKKEWFKYDFENYVKVDLNENYKNFPLKDYIQHEKCSEFINGIIEQAYGVNPKDVYENGKYDNPEYATQVKANWLNFYKEIEDVNLQVKKEFDPKNKNGDAEYIKLYGLKLYETMSSSKYCNISQDIYVYKAVNERNLSVEDAKKEYETVFEGREAVEIYAKARSEYEVAKANADQINVEIKNYKHYEPVKKDIPLLDGLLLPLTMRILGRTFSALTGNKLVKYENVKTRWPLLATSEQYKFIASKMGEYKAKMKAEVETRKHFLEMEKIKNEIEDKYSKEFEGIKNEQKEIMKDSQNNLKEIQDIKGKLEKLDGKLENVKTLDKKENYEKQKQDLLNKLESLNQKNKDIDKRSENLKTKVENLTDKIKYEQKLRFESNHEKKQQARVEYANAKDKLDNLKNEKAKLESLKQESLEKGNTKLAKNIEGKINKINKEIDKTEKRLDNAEKRLANLKIEKPSDKEVGFILDKDVSQKVDKGADKPTDQGQDKPEEGQKDVGPEKKPDGNADANKPENSQEKPNDKGEGGKADNPENKPNGKGEEGKQDKPEAKPEEKANDNVEPQKDNKEAEDKKTETDDGKDKADKATDDSQKDKVDDDKQKRIDDLAAKIKAKNDYINNKQEKLATAEKDLADAKANNESPDDISRKERLVSNIKNDIAKATKDISNLQDEINKVDKAESNSDKVETPKLDEFLENVKITQDRISNRLDKAQNIIDKKTIKLEANQKELAEMKARNAAPEVIAKKEKVIEAVKNDIANAKLEVERCKTDLSRLEDLTSETLEKAKNDEVENKTEGNSEQKTEQGAESKARNNRIGDTIDNFLSANKLFLTNKTVNLLTDIKNNFEKMDKQIDDIEKNIEPNKDNAEKPENKPEAEGEKTEPVEKPSDNGANDNPEAKPDNKGPESNGQDKPENVPVDNGDKDEKKANREAVEEIENMSAQAEANAIDEDEIPKELLEPNGSTDNEPIENPTSANETPTSEVEPEASEEPVNENETEPTNESVENNEAENGEIEQPETNETTENDMSSENNDATPETVIENPNDNVEPSFSKEDILNDKSLTTFQKAVAIAVEKPFGSVTIADINDISNNKDFDFEAVFKEVANYEAGLDRSEDIEVLEAEAKTQETENETQPEKDTDNTDSIETKTLYDKTNEVVDKAPKEQDKEKSSISNKTLEFFKANYNELPIDFDSVETMGDLLNIGRVAEFSEKMSFGESKLNEKTPDSLSRTVEFINKNGIDFSETKNSGDTLENIKYNICKGENGKFNRVGISGTGVMFELSKSVIDNRLSDGKFEQTFSELLCERMTNENSDNVDYKGQSFEIEKIFKVNDNGDLTEIKKNGDNAEMIINAVGSLLENPDVAESQLEKLGLADEIENNDASEIIEEKEKEEAEDKEEKEDAKELLEDSEDSLDEADKIADDIDDDVADSVENNDDANDDYDNYDDVEN